MRGLWVAPSKLIRFGLLVLTVVLVGSGCTRHHYENPITKDTEQPDKVLFDKAIKDLERGRYEVARLTLQTLINTYETSEYVAKAKLALADSWYLEGTSYALAQAEAEYKDFILFYPTMEEAAEAQMRICQIHYKQMEKPDRDMYHAIRAEDECRQFLVQYPNSKFAPEVEQLLRNIQEVIAEHEYRVGRFYHLKGSYPAAANRFQALTDHYPLFSKADDALWRLADSYQKMGPRFNDRAAAALARIVREYPLSPLVDEAKEQLVAMERDVPEPDPVALARMKYELANRETRGLWSRFWGIFRKSPDVSMAAKSGKPQMKPFQPTLPLTVPAASGEGTEVTGEVSAEVTATTITGPSALDTEPDARSQQPQQQQGSPQQ